MLERRCGCTVSLCQYAAVFISECANVSLRHVYQYVNMSMRQCVTVLVYQCVAVSRCHCVTVSPPQVARLSTRLRELEEGEAADSRAADESVARLTSALDTASCASY